MQAAAGCRQCRNVRDGLVTACCCFICQVKMLFHQHDQPNPLMTCRPLRFGGDLWGGQARGATATMEQQPSSSFVPRRRQPRGCLLLRAAGRRKMASVLLLRVWPPQRRDAELAAVACLATTSRCCCRWPSRHLTSFSCTQLRNTALDCTGRRLITSAAWQHGSSSGASPVSNCVSNQQRTNEMNE